MAVRATSGQGSVISWYLGRAFALCVAGLLFSPALSSSCLAQSVSYFGREFKVDKLERVDGDQLSIELDKRSFLVRSSNAGKQVFLVYAQKPELLTSGDLQREYGAFIGSLAVQGESDAVFAAIRGLLASREVSGEQKKSVFGGIVTSQQGEAMLQEQSLHAQGEARTGSCLALTVISPDGRSAIKQLLPSNAAWMTSQCPRILVTSAQISLESGDRVSGAETLELVGEFFAGSGGEISQAAKTSSERLSSVQKAIDSGNAEQFESELRVASFDALLGGYFQSFKPTLVLEFGERALTQHQSAAVLRGLSLLDFSQRNTRHHELLLKAVQELQCKDLAVLQMEAVKKMLSAYAYKDEAAKQQYLAFLSACVEKLGESDEPRSGIAFVTLLSDIRPDPSLENDMLRSALAESFFDRGDQAGADMVLLGVRTRLPWINRFRLLVKSDAYVLGMVLLGLLVVVRWLLKAGGVLRKRTSAQKRSEQHKATSEGKDPSGKEKDKERLRYSGNTLSKQVYKGLDEYGDGLSKLNLAVGASLQDIKNAYRNVVKALHPDMNPNATREDTDKFIELTKTYERLVELHEEREKRSSDSED